MAGNKKMVAKFPEADDESKAVARLTLQASANAAAVMNKYTSNIYGETDLGALIDELVTDIKQVQGGDMRKVEAMLMGQAEALQSMFVSLARRTQSQQYQSNLESFFRMAMKAQNQCRMTLETLATIKNPPMVYAKQANIANGPQQVNNGTPSNVPHAPAREEKTIQSNELLTEGVEHGPTLDARGATTAGGTDKELATMGEIDRPTD
jgi:predicted S18 family serine protease